MVFYSTMHGGNKLHRAWKEAAEVIKVMSKKERPVNNALFLDGAAADGIVQRLGPSFDCPWGLDKGAFTEVGQGAA